MTQQPVPTIGESYSHIAKYYDTILNKDKKLVKTTNDEPTPMACVDEMIAKVPEDFWKNPEHRILDPCCGCGNFPLAIYYKLRSYHTKEHILSNMLFFNDTNSDRLDVLRTVFNSPLLTITTQDFLQYPDDKHFDLIVANPPYAKLLPNGKRASKNHNLIGCFIEKSFQILNPGGLLLYITPDNWMSIADRNHLITELTQKQILYLNIHIAKKYFKKVGSSFVYYLIENKPHYKDITIEGIWKKKLYKDSVKSETRRFIPLFYNRTIQSILHKTIDDTTKEKFHVQTSSDLHKYTKKQFIVATEDDQHPYKLIHTPKQTVWSSRPHKFQKGYKVFLSTTSYYGTFVDNCGMTQSIAFIQCSSKKEAERISAILQHPMYKFLNDICRYGNFNNIRILQRFPKCTSHDSVYDECGITPEEQEFIESHV